MDVQQSVQDVATRVLGTDYQDFASHLGEMRDHQEEAVADAEALVESARAWLEEATEELDKASDLLFEVTELDRMYRNLNMWALFNVKPDVTVPDEHHPYDEPPFSYGPDEPVISYGMGVTLTEYAY
jgi:hypothetical protein